MSFRVTEHPGLKFKEPEPVYETKHDDKPELPEEINGLSWSEETN